jgi:hypothetical protein
MLTFASFAPIIAGFINDAQGWQWVLVSLLRINQKPETNTLKYWCAIFCGIGFVFLFFFMEETNYVRHTVGTSPSTPVSMNPSETADPEKETPLESSAVSSRSPSYKCKTYLDKIKLFQKSDLQKPNQLVGMMTRPLKFATFPVIFYAGFSYGSNLVWFNVLNATASLILGGTYGFAPSMVGVSYVSPLIGVALAAAYTGWVGDWFVVRKARKNGGFMESEHRLWLFAPSFVLVPFGLILWGVGAYHKVHWFGPVFAMGVIAMTNTFGIQLSIAYCIDSYRALSGEAIITVILIRNTMSFAIGYGITPWVTDMGLQNCFITAAFVGLAQVMTVWMMIKWGKELRRKSVPRYSKYVQEMTEAGMVH